MSYCVIITYSRGAPIIWEFWFLLIPILFCRNLPIKGHQYDVYFTLICHAMLEY